MLPDLTLRDSTRVRISTSTAACRRDRQGIVSKIRQERSLLTRHRSETIIHDWRIWIMSQNRFRVLIVFLVAGIVARASMEPGRLLAASQADAGKAAIQERLNRVSAGLFSRADRINEAIRELNPH